MLKYSQYSQRMKMLNAVYNVNDKNNNIVTFAGMN